LAAAELRRLIRLVDPDVLALVAVDALINVIVAGWDWEEEICRHEGGAVGRSNPAGRDRNVARLRDPDKIDYRWWQGPLWPTAHYFCYPAVRSNPNCLARAYPL